MPMTRQQRRERVLRAYTHEAVRQALGQLQGFSDLKFLLGFLTDDQVDALTRRVIENHRSSERFNARERERRARLERRTA